MDKLTAIVNVQAEQKSAKMGYLDWIKLDDEGMRRIRPANLQQVPLEVVERGKDQQLDIANPAGSEL